MSPPSLVRQLFRDTDLSELCRLVDLDADHVIDDLDLPASRDRLRDAELVIGGWGAPRIAVEDAPRLRAVIYAGGVAATCLAEPARWADRGLLVANARAVNAIPVAEYALATILLANKAFFAAERRYRETRTMPDRGTELADAGNFGRTVGIVGMSQVAQVLVELLRPFDLNVVVFDPFLTPEEAAAFGVRRATLEEVMSSSDIVSLHQALTPATVGQIDASMLALMPTGATLLNTARGAVVDQDALIAELRTGRIRAVLDVTEPEPLPADSELWGLPNVVLTPHLAGSVGTELHRIGAAVVGEARRLAAGEPFACPERLA